LGIKRLIVKGDSQLVVNFSNKSYTPKDEHMAAYLEEHRVGVLDTRVSRSTCSWAPSTAQLRPRGKLTTEAQRRRPS
jgi:hypothetical protein